MLPVRKEVVGQEAVTDCVILIVQFWPSEELSQTDPKSAEERQVLALLKRDVIRVFSLIHGEERSEGYMRLGLSTMVDWLIELTRNWWRRRKSNRGKVTIWRRKWIANSDE